MADTVETGRITTDIPARLDRLPVGPMALAGGDRARHGVDPRRARGHHRRLDERRAEARQHRARDEQLPDRLRRSGRTSPAPASGRLFFGQLTDRFGRKKLFLITLGVYTVATVLTAFSMNPMWYFAARFLTGTGIGGEYAAINSAIDELIPAKFRGRVDVAINGSFWVGAAAGSLLTIPLLDPNIVNPALGLAARLRARRRPRGRHPARAPQRAGEPALAVHPRPRGGGRADRPRHRADGRRGDRRGAALGRARRSPSGSGARSASSRSRRPSSRSTRSARSCASRCSSARRSSTTPSSSPTATP